MSDEQKKCQTCGDLENTVVHNSFSWGHHFRPAGEKVQAIERMAEAADREGRYDDVILPETKPEVPVQKAESLEHHTSGWIEEVKRDPRPLDDKQLWGEPEPQQVIPEDLRETYERAKDAKSFKAVNSSTLTCSLIERLGAAERQLKEAKAGWDSTIADLRTAAEICRKVEAERDRLQSQLGAAEQRIDEDNVERNRIRAERDRLKEQLQTSEQLRFAAEREIDDTLDAIGASGERRDSELSHQVRAKIAEVEGELAEATATIEIRDSYIFNANHALNLAITEGRENDAQVRREALELAVEAVRLSCYQSHAIQAIHELIGGKP